MGGSVFFLEGRREGQVYRADYAGSGRVLMCKFMCGRGGGWGVDMQGLDC